MTTKRKKKARRRAAVFAWCVLPPWFDGYLYVELIRPTRLLARNLARRAWPHNRPRIVRVEVKEVPSGR